MEIYLVTILDEPSLLHHKGKPIKIEVNKPVEQDAPGSEVRIEAPCKRKNTGIQVTISNDTFPVVTHLQALPFKELPAAYLLSNLPRVWQNGDRLLAGDGYILLKKGQSYSCGTITNALQYIRLAGEHLAMVKQDKEKRWLNPKTTTFKDGRLKGCTPRE